MNNLVRKIVDISLRKKALSIFVFMIFVLILSLLPNFVEKRSSKQNVPEKQEEQVPLPVPPTGQFDQVEAESPRPITDMPGLQKKEALPSGQTLYVFSSQNPKRTKIVIGQGEEENILFERSIVPQNDHSPKAAEYLSAYGKPETIRMGPASLGETQVYAYPSQGISFTVSLTTDKVVELHVFKATSFEQYAALYGQYVFE